MSLAPLTLCIVAFRSLKEEDKYVHFTKDWGKLFKRSSYEDSVKFLIAAFGGFLGLRYYREYMREGDIRRILKLSLLIGAGINLIYVWTVYFLSFTVSAAFERV